MTLMKTLTIAALLATAGATTFMVTHVPTAEAQASSAKATVEKAKAEGVIGESIAGYLAVVAGKSPSAAQRAAMDEINIGRKKVYTDRARAENVGVAQVARVTGEQLIAKAPPGQMVLLEDGSWSTN